MIAAPTRPPCTHRLHVAGGTIHARKGRFLAELDDAEQRPGRSAPVAPHGAGSSSSASRTAGPTPAGSSWECPSSGSAHFW
ncbi:hypothetical protein FRACA_4470003 [Frankia canadensis]|uniref:Uncharacterized protein n=1 Tax=Frankia canadensis TaxID=1836972 RepID=A0A2I2KXH9_9ACTN|nr:hypothetical protein FRACA_4470003 [Frankia canadensis]SOU57657.1 hypothetical protein FRACA_4470003 [Frankia canadensis]